MNPFIKDRPSPLQPAGENKGAWLAVLEQGAHLLQDTTPLNGFHVYVVGFHPAKDEPSMQMEAHHYCRMVNDDLLHCVLFDGNTREANLIGVEYIISERLESIKQHRNTHMNIDAERKREQRQTLLPLAHPQEGVDVLKDAFPGGIPIPGVIDVRDADPDGGR